jgi:hypothetical protein
LINEKATMAVPNEVVNNMPFPQLATVLNRQIVHSDLQLLVE